MTVAASASMLTRQPAMKSCGSIATSTNNG
jgi:hypothetical protein